MYILHDPTQYWAVTMLFSRQRRYLRKNFGQLYRVIYLWRGGGGGGIIFKVQEQLHVYDTTEAARCQSVTTVDIGESPVTVIAGPTGVARPPRPHQTGRLSSGGLLYRRHFGGARVSVLAQTSPVLN